MMDTWDMPDWRREDGTLMIWDSSSHTYVEGPAEGGDLAVDRGHASGGDNDLFDPTAGNDGDGDGNLFQPSNPDNNGWLDGKTSSADDPYVCPDCGFETHNNIYDCPECGLELKDEEDTSQVLEHVAMAMRPEQWQEIIGQNPYVYHVTEANRLPSVQQHGLAPGSTISEKTEGVWGEAGGIPARQGFVYLWATAEGAEHGAEWFLGIPNPIILTIDATKLDPNLIEADEDLLAADPQGFVDQHGGPTPDEYYGDTDEYDQGNWSGYDPMQIAEEPGSAWSMNHPKLGDPDVTYESYQGFGDRGDHHGRIAYGGSIPPDAILSVSTLDDFRTSKTADTAVMEPPTVAPAMPDINYVLDHNPEDLHDTGWNARYNNDKLGVGHVCADCYREGLSWTDARDFLEEMAPEEIAMNALEFATPDKPFHFEYQDAWLGRCTYDISKGRLAKTAEVAEAPTIAPAMPDINYVLDHNPEDVTAPSWKASIWGPAHDAVWKANPEFRDKFEQNFKGPVSWRDAQQFLLANLNREIVPEGEKAIVNATPDQEFSYKWSRSGDPQWYVEWRIEQMAPGGTISKIAMPYWHQSPRENRESIEEKGLLPGRDGNVYLTSDGDFGDTGDIFDNYLVDPSEKLGLDPTGDAESYGWGGKWWAHPGPISPDRLKRVSMSEQTGEPTLDGFIHEFAQMMDAEQLRDPRNSWGQCIYHSEEFAAFLKQRGVDAKVIVLPRDEEWGKTQTLLTDPNYSDEEWAQTGITWNEAPQGATLNNLGYQGGDFEDHHAVQVDMNGHTYIVDWTATQYEGQNEVPQIFRADDSDWQREF